MVEPAGRYLGTLNTGAGTLRLRLIVTKGSDGSYTATLVSLDQGNASIPASTVTINGASIALKFASIGATFDGRVMESWIEGTFRQGAVIDMMVFRLEGEGPVAQAVAGPLTQAKLHTVRTLVGTPAMGAAWQGSAMTLSRRGKAVKGRALPSTIIVDGKRASTADAAVTQNDKWHLGSITKNMTATMIARLVDQGLLSWNTTVGSVLGAEFPSMHAQYRDATVLQLLNHRSGMPANVPPDAFARAMAAQGDIAVQRRDWVNAALSQEPEATRDGVFTYSNSGYVVAAAMAEKRAGASWEMLIQRELFAPLGITSAGFGVPSPVQNPTHPVGHAMQGDQRLPLPVDNPDAMRPAGGVHMALHDLLTYLAAHRDRTSLLKPATWAVLHGDTSTFYSCGWMLKDGTLWHNGSNTLWYAEVRVSRTDGAIAAVVSNDTASLAGAPGPILQSAVRAALRDQVKPAR